ncbi:MAG: mobilization protein [Bradyrhizobium sp.]|nr:mobilization protein [Bradyrhizobium sp.]
MGRKPNTVRIAELEERKKQIEAKLATLAAHEKVFARKRDTRRKVIVGAAVLAHAERDAEFARRLQMVLTLAVMREGDRLAIADLLPASPQTSHP